MKIELKRVDKKTYNSVSYKNTIYSKNSYVSWGEQNDYPDYLYDLYSNCSTLQSIIERYAQYVMGDEFINNSQFQGVNIFGDDLEDIASKLILDRLIYGGFAFKVQYNILGSPITLAYVDLLECRVSEDYSKVMVYDKWKGYSTSKYTEYNAYNPETGAEDGVQIFYYKGKKTKHHYPIPNYSATIKEIKTEIEIGTFHYEEITNNFSSTAYIYFPNGLPEAEVEGETEQDIIDKYTGAINAGNTLVGFGEGKDNAPIFQRIPTDDLPDRYNNSSDHVKAKIYGAMGALPILFGQQINTGFAEQNYDDAFKMCNRTVIKPLQKELIKGLETVLGEGTIEIKPFSYGEETVETENTLQDAE